MVIREGRAVGGVALATLFFTLLAGSAHAALNAAQKTLEQQGRYWEDRNQPERASEAWNKLLESSPNNSEALLHLGLIAARAGNEHQAQNFAALLKATNAGGPESGVLDRAIKVGAIDSKLIDEARGLARKGQYDAAMVAYRKALKDHAPPPDLAQEYYETLAGTKTGWAEARDGLHRVATALPDDLAVQYAYARVLTYHEETRRQGIAMMASLSGDPSVGHQAMRGWHDGLMWLAATPADAALYRNYLAANAGDKPVEQKLAALKNPAKAAVAGKDDAHARAFEALNASRWSEAGKRFAALLKTNPQDVDALGGLGVVREREGKLDEARQLLSRAVSLVHGGNTRWRDALDSVIYLQAVDEGRAALAVHRWRLAETRAHEALAHPHGHDVNAELILAEAARQTQRWPEAERGFRQVLRTEPRNREAAAGLAAVLAATGRVATGRVAPGRVAQARRVNARPSAPPPRFGQPPGEPPEIPRTAAQRLADETRVMLNHGQANMAVTAYRLALAQDPTNPWLKLDYARLLTRIGDRTDADHVIETMAKVPHPSGEILAAAAIWYGEHGDFERAASYAERVPPGTLVAEFPTMAHQWIATRDARQAVQLARQGRVADAYRILNGIIAGARGNVGVVGVAADAFVDIGDSKRAVSVMRDALGPAPSLDDEIQYAGVLMRVRKLDELTRVMHVVDLQANAANPSQQARIADLHRGFAIQLADRARLKGDYADAYDRLAPELAISHDPTVLAALARIYDSAGRRGEALDIYERILRASPANTDARREIITAAIQVGDYHRARALLKEGLAKTPNDPRLHLLAAELARADGDDEIALAELSTAQAELAHSYGGKAGAAGVPGYLANANPFRQPSAAGASSNSGQAYSAYGVAPTYNVNPAYPVPQLNGGMPLAPVSPEDRQLAQDVAQQMEQVKDPMRPYVQGGMEFRDIDGESGLSQFSLVTLPISGGARVGPGELVIEVTPTFADAGTLDTTDPGVFRRFGTNATIAPGGGAPGYDGSATGTGVTVGYSMVNLAAELGITPIGFPTENWIGHLVWAIPIDRSLSVKLTAFRDPVIQSLLSYAGTRDPSTGNVWGGVIKSGGRFDIGYDNGMTGVYGDATFGWLDGQHVASNYMVDAGGGAYWRPYRSDTGGIKMGVNLSVQTYNKNLDYYTYGQGGYFSPQTAIEATLPVEYTGKWRGVSYSLKGQVGVMNFHETSSPYFPLDPNLQALAEANSPTAFYTGQTVTTAIYGVTAKTEYEIAPMLTVGAQVSADNSYDYNEQSLMIYLRKKFDTY
jgi:tetratricopeptide (TPR) repeat protein